MSPSWIVVRVALLVLIALLLVARSNRGGAGAHVQSPPLAEATPVASISGIPPAMGWWPNRTPKHVRTKRAIASVGTSQGRYSTRPGLRTAGREIG